MIAEFTVNWEIVRTIFFLVGGFLSIVLPTYMFFRNIKSQLKDDFKEFKADMKADMKEFKEEIKINLASFEKRMDSFDAKVISLDEKMFLLSTGKTLAEAIREERMKTEGGAK